MFSLNIFSIWAVTHRQYVVWRKLFWSSIATNIANPILFLFAFGFGLGRLVDEMSGIDYMAFVVPGMVAYSAMFASSFETTIGSFSRYYLHQNWDAVLSTPVSLEELMIGEVLWASIKAMLSAVCVLVVGGIWGGILSLQGIFVCMPIIFIASMCFGAVGLLATAYAKGYEFFSYFFTFWVTPMFVFCGVFFETSRFPEFIQFLSWFLPMSHLVDIVRPLLLGASLDIEAVVFHISYILVIFFSAFYIAHRKMRQRLFD